jgi:heme/copper-type cytochrome/quinol oxidase subunit 2
MEVSTNARVSPLGGAWRGLAWIAGALATAAAAALAAVLALFFAATVVVIAVMASVLVAFAGLALRARRSVRSKDPTLIEARNVGGHSWVAYGWDQHGR